MAEELENNQNNEVSALIHLVKTQAAQVSDLREDLRRSVEGIRISLDALRSDLSERQERAHGRQWPIVLSAAGVIVAIGALVAGGFTQDINRVELSQRNLSAAVTTHTDKEGHWGQKANAERLDSLEVWQHDVQSKLAGVAANAASAVRGNQDLMRRFEAYQQKNDKITRSLEYRVTKQEE